MRLLLLSSHTRKYKQICCTPSLVVKQSIVACAFNLLSAQRVSKEEVPIMSESAYLKEDLGPVLAKGLAAVAMARPSNPADYLAMWLLHHLQQRERKVTEVQKLKELEAERELWAKGRAQREKIATTIIQREWRAHTSAVEDQHQKEAALRDIFSQIEETLEEKFPEETITESGDKSEAEKEAEQNRLSSQVQFNRSKLFVAELDKSHIADIKKIPSTNVDAMQVLKCCFYAHGLRPKQLDSAEKVRALIKPYPFTQFLVSFDPIGAPLQKKRMISRVRRLLSKIDEDALKVESAAIHAIFSWLNSAVRYRTSRDEHIKVKKAAGKEVDEEYEEEEDNEEEEKDVEEEAVKAEEAEIQRKLEAERAAEAAEETAVEE
jgi:hypothetical protein